MDGSRFDDLARGLAQIRTRRSVLKGLIGGLAALAGVRPALAHHSEDHCAKEGHRRTSRKPCCPGLTSGKDLRCYGSGNPCDGVSCPAPDACHGPGTCNPDNGQCSAAAVLANTCFINGVCRTPGEVNPANPCQVCNPTASTTTWSAAANGTVCDDGNKCTQTDTCQAGVCQGSNPVVCTASDECHVAGVCDPGTGTCSNPNAPDTTPCNDGNACTTGDYCQAGVCTGGAALVCTTDNPCLTASCNTASGCVTTPKEAGAACSDGVTCNGEEMCDGAGLCVAGTAGSCGPCTTCDLESGQCVPANEGSVCTGTGNLCFGSFTCQGGTCAGAEPVTCTAQDECHEAGICDPGTGLCSNPDKPNDTACNVDNLCRSGDTCQAGVCTGGTATVCTALDQCHVAGVCVPASGKCSNPKADDGTPCAPGNICTENTVCTNGICGGGSTVDCQIAEYCILSSCDTELGCLHVEATPIYDENNPCYVRACDPYTGEWRHQPNGQCSSCGQDVGYPCDADSQLCPGLVCGDIQPDTGLGTIQPTCGVEGGCGTACGSYIVAGEYYITDPIVFEDDLRILVNGAALFDSVAAAVGKVAPPIGPFTAAAGDTLELIATNTYGGCRRLDRVVLWCADGSAAQMVNEFVPVECGFTPDNRYGFPASDEPFFTASIAIDI